MGSEERREDNITYKNNRNDIQRSSEDNTKIFIDASNAGFISTLKHQMGDYDYRTYTEQKNIINHMYDPRRDYNNVQVFPVNFASMHKDYGYLLYANIIISS